MRTLDVGKIKNFIDTICTLLANFESVSLGVGFVSFHKKSPAAQEALDAIKKVQVTLTSIVDNQTATEQVLEKICYTIASHLAACYIGVQGNVGIVSHGKQDLMRYFHDELGVNKKDSRDVVQSAIFTNILAKVDVRTCQAESSLTPRH